MSTAAGLLLTDDPSRSYTLKTSSARPTPCVPSTTFARTLCVATVITRPRARARFLLSLCRRRRRSTLPHRLRLRVKNFLLFVTFSVILLSLSPFLPLFWSRYVSSAVLPRVAPTIFRLQVESGAYTQDPHLHPAFRGGTPVLVP